MSAIVLVPSQYAPNAAAVMFGPAGSAIIIDNVATRNADSGAVDLSIWIIPPGGSAGDDNLFVKKSIAAADVYGCPEITHMHLGIGDSVKVLASVASKVSIRITGRTVA